MAVAKDNYAMRYKAASGKTVNWKVLGLSSLVPIYEDIQHGAEIGFTDEGYISAKRSENMVLSKCEILSSEKR